MRGTKTKLKIVRFCALPLILYAAIFCVLTYPLITKFSSHFFTDTGDGITNIWNIWWVNKAVTELHQNPWHTNHLHFPTGTTLIAHTLNPFNGFLGIVLLKFSSLIQTFNIILIFTFVAGGMIAFYLSYYLTRSYWGSVLGGAVFTFSNFHFTHAEGHLQMASLEWIPLFVLCWFVFVKKPAILMGLASAFVLFLVLLCDYYYFLYCVMAGILIYLWSAWQRKNILFLLRRKCIAPLLSFVGGVAATSGPIVYALLDFSRKNVVLGVHHAKVYSLDLLAPLIPGGHWRFGELTKPYWEKLTCGIHESSVHMGIPVIFALVFAWVHRRKIQNQSLKLWYGILLFFMVLSLGPVMHIWGKELSWFKLPYAWLEAIFPPLRLSGVPVRMMVMVMLCASVITAFGFDFFMSKRKMKKGLLIFLLALLCVEYYPRPVPASKVEVPGYVAFLKELPAGKGVIDTVASESFALYYQTVHEKPMSGGYIARISENVVRRNQRIRQLVDQQDFSLLFRRYHFRYYVSDGELIVTTVNTPIKMIFNDGNIKVYDLGAGF